MRQLFTGLFCLSSVVLLTPRVSAAENGFSILDPRVPVVHHEKKGGELFPASAFDGSKPNLGAVLQPMKAERTVREKKGSEIPYATRLPQLPDCSMNSVSRVPAGTIMIGNRSMDFIVYNPRSSSQRNLAANWRGNTVAYESGRVAKKGDKLSASLSVAISLGANCLPSRIHFPTENRIQYFEIRQGERAWDRDRNN